MPKDFKNISIYILLVLALLFMTAKSDANSFSLSIFPPITQIDVAAPATIKTPIWIYNKNDQIENVSIYIKPFTSSSLGNGEVNYDFSNSQANRSDNPLYQHIEIQDDKNNKIDHISLNPGQNQKINLLINVPSSITNGDIYFSIIFQDKNSSNKDTSHAEVSGAIASHVILSIGKRSDPQGDITEFSSPPFLSHGPVHFKIKVENNSTFYIQPKGFITIKNIYNQTVGKVSLLPVNVLAKSSRYIPDDISNSDKEAIWPEKFIIGTYKATVAIALSEKGPIIEKTVTFFAFPFEILILMLILSLFVLIIAKRINKRLNRI